MTASNRSADANTCVYKWTNALTGETYIGITIRLATRVKQHRQSSEGGKHTSPDFHAALGKSPNSFTMEVIAEGLTRGQAIFYERQLIAYERLSLRRGRCLNIHPGLRRFEDKKAKWAALPESEKQRLMDMGSIHYAEEIDDWRCQTKYRELGFTSADAMRAFTNRLKQPSTYGRAAL